MSDDFKDRLLHQLRDEELPGGAAGVVRSYMAGFTGAHFQTYAPTSPDRIEPADLVAVTLLTMKIARGKKGGDIQPIAAVAIEERQARVGELLASIPSDLSLAQLTREQFEQLLDSEKSPADGLYHLLHDLLEPGESDRRSAMTETSSVTERLGEIREQAGVASDVVSDLRLADIVVWMRNKP